MDKQVFIDKIAFITEELQQISNDWIRKDYQIDPLEVETYLSNIRYLSEQASILKKFLESQQIEVSQPVHVPSPAVRIEEPVAQIEVSQVETPKVEIPKESVEANISDDLHMHIGSIPVTKNIPKPEVEVPVSAKEESENAELSLHERLSEQSKEHSIAESLKHHFFHKDLTFSLNEKFFAINQLFNGDTNDFNRVMSHLATLDSWEEVEMYLNATCYIPYSWEEKMTERNQFYKMLKDRFEE